MEKKDLAKSIYNVSHIRGSFTLRSGQISNEYFDKYLFEADPSLLVEIAKHLSTMIPVHAEVLAGLEMGGIPIATAISLQTGLPLALVRKKAKEYGTQKIIEGTDIQNRRVCIIEDVVTTGGQIIQSARDIEKLGAQIVGVLCVIERDSISRSNLNNEGLKLSALFTMAELESKV
jgi:orotate phosphoribosyltransferase